MLCVLVSYSQILPTVAKLTLLEFAVGSIMTWLYLLTVGREIRINASILKAFGPVSLAYSLGHILTNYSFGATSLAFAHTVKVREMQTCHLPMVLACMHVAHRCRCIYNSHLYHRNYFAVAKA